ncbi:hypothetical protein SteCoe_10627 [Stentor coeruleus]|uniref:Cilia- and flagella-associated protein 45 n=1 Tax=Stentor coeruleus TaxID=5963 RepID=A0A1R2CF37_9CILI|nr:hypothetical protein SteCoe_10627 [Stentor coeruleus]
MKSHGSVASSKKSGGSYKKVSDRSEVDEALFGAKASGSVQGGKISEEQIRKVKTMVLQGTTPETAAVIPLTEIQRMKAAAVLKTKEELLSEHKVLEEQKEQQRAAAKARKERMMQLENERQKAAPLTESEKEQKERDKFFKERAKQMLDQEFDDVKTMNQMVLYAKVVTVRDEQLKEKKNITGEKQKIEDQLDLMMEVERLKVIKYHDEREHKWKEDRLQGASVLKDQIKERELIRMKEQEILEKERQQMLKQIQLLQEEEMRQAKEKMEMQEKLMGEVEEVNRRAILIKEDRKRSEREEDEKIMKYNIEKSKREQEVVEEQERIRAEKEREVQRLRERQERAKDRQSELDALRAKRAQEAQERVEREKEKKEAEKIAKINKELEEARNHQAREKEIRLIIQAKQERDEFERIIMAQKEAAEAERKQEEAKAEIRKQHANQLKTQILMNSEKKSLVERENLEEGRKLRNEIEGERKKLETIRVDKLDGLKSDGIPDKYCADLSRKKVSV